MGSSHSVEIPGGGTEGYHVLKVIILKFDVGPLNQTFNSYIYNFTGAR